MDIKELLAFRQMVTPMIIQIIFWVGIVFIVLAALGTMTQSFLAGIGALIIGPLMWRIWCELMIVIFRINDNLAELNAKAKSAPLGDARD